MNALDRSIAVFRRARRKDPLAVVPGQVLSPMDAQRTVTISRELIDACEPRRSAPATG